MNKRLIAVAFAAALASNAQAQSVTIYGIVDSGIEYVSKVATAGGNDSLTRLNAGGIAPPIWGFRGTEDLGGGLKASFNLEGDFDSGTGGARFGTLGLFGRQANVGLSGGFGTVTLGRQYAPSLVAEFGTDPRGYKESYSSIMVYALNQAPAGNEQTGNNFLGIFNGNSISYANTFGPVTARVGYGFGEVAGATKVNSTMSLGLTYVGPVTGSLSYQKARGTDDAQTQRFAVGLAVPFGDLTAKALLSRSKGDDITGAEAFETDNHAVGVDYAWDPKNTANVSFYYGKDKLAGGGTTKTLVMSNDHSFSKRTVLYAQLVYVDVGDAASIRTQITGGLTPNGEKATIVGVGLKHSF